MISITETYEFHSKYDKLVFGVTNDNRLYFDIGNNGEQPECYIAMEYDELVDFINCLVKLCDTMKEKP